MDSDTLYESISGNLVRVIGLSVLTAGMLDICCCQVKIHDLLLEGLV